MKHPEHAAEGGVQTVDDAMPDGLAGFAADVRAEAATASPGATRQRRGLWTRLAGRGRRKGAPQPQGPASPQFAMASTGTREIGLVFGVHWQAILGADLRGQALRKARQARATHWAHAGGRAESVGTASLPAARRRARTEWHAAAQLWAGEAGAGMHAGAWSMDHGIWVVCARDGQVVAGSDLLLCPARAREALAAAHARFGAGLRWHGGAQALAAGGAAMACPAPELAALAARAGGHSLLQPRGTGRGPLALLLAAALLSGGLLLSHYGSDDAGVPDTPYPAAAELDSLYVQEAWQLAYTRFARTLAMPGNGALAHAWDVLAGLPLLPAGWLLTDAACEWMAAAWHCQASYRRAAPAALAGELVGALPAGWNASWPALDAGLATRTVAAAAAGLDLAAVRRQAAGIIEDADALQVVRAAFSDMQVGAAQQLAVAAPVSEHGVRLPRPAGLPELQSRTLRLRGPWRSLALLDGALQERVAWRRLAMRIDPAAQPGIAESTIMADLEGVVYETQG